jgi:hypothetical protein
MATITTGWTVRTCRNLEVTSTNGSETNFDDFVFVYDALTTSQRVCTFDDRPGNNQPLDGLYCSIDWNAGQWFESPPTGAFSTDSASLTEGLTAASYTYDSPSRLITFQAYNGSDSNAVLRVTCSGNADSVSTLAGGEYRTIATGFANPCSQVTWDFSSGWATNIDNLFIQR